MNLNTFTVDTTAPIASITSHISTNTNDTPSFTFTTDKIGTLTTTISQGFSSSSTISSTGSHIITFNSLPEEEYSGKTITLTDAAENATTMNLNTFTVDTTAPNASITSHISTYTNDTTPSFTFTTNEIGTLTTTISQGFSSSSTISSTGSHTITFNTLSEAEYSGETITLTDSAGNTVTRTLNTFTVDTTAPNASITSHISTYTNNTPSFTFTTNEIGTLTTTISQGFSSSSTISPTGSHTITFNTLPGAEYSGKTITLTDAAGNTTTMNLNTFTVDTTAPTASITSHISTYTNDTTPNFTFTTNETGTLTTTISQGFFSNSTISSTGLHTITFNTLPEAEYSGKTITLTDAAGNTTTMNLNTFTVDSTPPGDISFITPFYSKRIGGATVGIGTSDSVSNEVWLAPTGTNSFSASISMNQAATGLSTSIGTPTGIGSYYLHIKDSAGNINEIPQALQVVLPTQNSGTYPGYMKNLYLDDDDDKFHSILSSNEVSSNINIQRNLNKTYYSNIPRNSDGLISFNPFSFNISSSHKFYLTLSEEVSPLDLSISIQTYSNGGFGIGTSGGSVGIGSSISSTVLDEKRYTRPISFTNNNTNYYKIMINEAGNLAASTYIEHYVALCHGKRPHFMHYLNPFFNTSRPIYIKLYAWKLPTTDTSTESALGENVYYNNLKGGWLQCMISPYAIYGMKMTNCYMYHSSYTGMGGGNCAHTHGKRWFGRNKTDNTINNSTYGTRTNGGNYWDTTDEISSTPLYVDNHNSYSNSDNCWCTWKVTYKQADPANAPDETTWDDWGTETGANAGEYKYHIWNKKADDYSMNGTTRTGGATVASGAGDASYGVNNVGGAKSSGHIGNPVGNTWSWADGDRYVNKEGTITTAETQLTGTLEGRDSHNLRGIEITGIRNNTTLLGRIFCVKDNVKQYIVYEDSTPGNIWGIAHSSHYSYTEFRIGGDSTGVESKGTRNWQIRILDPSLNDNSDSFNSNASLTKTDV